MNHKQSEYWDEALETSTSEELYGYQEARLNKQLDYVWEKSEFYRSKFQRLGISRSDVKTLDDLSGLPFTEKHELRDSQLQHPPLGNHMACTMQDVKRVYSTSGTTGRPTFIGLTANDIAVWRKAHCRAFWVNGLRHENITPLPVAPFVVAASFSDALEEIGTLVPIGIGATDRLISAFQYIGADSLLATASFPLHFADALKRRGINPKDLGIKLIMAGGEPGAAIPSVREEIENTFGCTILESAGNGDVCGVIWSECKFKRGMHFIGHGLVHPELIEPESGKVLDIDVNVQGELVYTSLDRECIPLVRFRSRDHAIVTQTECECGRTGYGIRLIGRTDDMLIVQGINVYPAAVRATVASLYPRTSGAIEIQLRKPPPEGWKPPIEIKVEHGQHPESLDKLRDELEQLIREKLLFRSKVTLVPPGSLPHFEYKARLVNKVYEHKEMEA